MKIEDKSFGTMKEIVQQAHNGNAEFFEPFTALLKDTNDTLIEDVDEAEYNEEDETEEE